MRRYNNFIYALQLKNNKFYVGKTINPENRISDHMRGKGSKWTKLHPVKHVIYLNKEINIFHEDALTKYLMMVYGISNIRGGTYSNVNLNECQLKILQVEFDTMFNRCFNCTGLSVYCKNKQCKHKESENKESDQLKCPPCYYCNQYGHRLFNQKLNKIECPLLINYG